MKQKAISVFIFLLIIQLFLTSSISAMEPSNGIKLTDKNFQVEISELYSDAVRFSWSYPTGLEGKTYVKLVNEKTKSSSALHLKETSLGFANIPPSTKYTAYFYFVNEDGYSTPYKLSFSTKPPGNEAIYLEYIDLKGSATKEGALLTWHNDIRMDSYKIFRNNELIAEVSSELSSYIDSKYYQPDSIDYGDYDSTRVNYDIEAYLDGKYMGNDYFTLKLLEADYDVNVQGINVTFTTDTTYREYHVYLENNHYVAKLSKDKNFYNLYEVIRNNEKIIGSYKVSDDKIKIAINNLMTNKTYKYHTQFIASSEFNEDEKQYIKYNEIANNTGEFTTTNDIDSHWASSAISQVIEKDIMSGYSNGLFKPNKEITRAEFITAFINMTGIEISTNKNGHSFRDINNKDWYAPYIFTALEYKLISESDYFLPNDYITRQEIAVFINRLLKINNSSSDTLNEYADVNQISPWALNAMSAMVHLDIMSGDIHRKLNPTSHATRAETSVILMKVWNYLNL